MLNESTHHAGVTTGILCQSARVAAKIRAKFAPFSARRSPQIDVGGNLGGIFVQEVIEIGRG